MTLALTTNKTLKCRSHSGGDNVAIGIQISLLPHLHTPFPTFSPSLINLMVSVGVKHHVYLLNGQ